MKTISDKVTAAGKRRVTIELDRDETIMSFRDGEHYKLGQPVDEVLAGHVITSASRVNWCSASQEWVA